jgi:type IV pilus assembly protein PilC
MKNYIYRAKDASGQEFIGHEQAEDAAHLRAKLRNNGYFPMRITLEHNFRIKDVLSGMRSVGLDELVIFCQQFSTMINSGLPILSALDIIWKQTENKRLQIIISKIRNDLSAGSSLYEAVKKHDKVFPPIFISLVQVGEVSGTLSESLQNLLVYFTKEYETRQRVKSAFVYPTIVIIVAVLVVAFMVIHVVPVFSKVFSGVFGGGSAALPLPTAMLILISDLTRTFWWVGPVVLAGLVFTMHILNKTEHGKYLIDSFKLKIPLFGKLIHKVAVSRFVRALGIIIKAGVPINLALRTSCNVTGNYVIHNIISVVEKRIVAGSNLSQPLHESGYFPEIIVQMIATGEEAGTLDSMLISAADQMDQEIDYRVKKIIVALEPTLTIFLAFVVGFIAIALYLPLFETIKLIR